MTSSEFDMSRVTAMFVAAKTKFKHPVFRASLGPNYPELRLTVAGSRARFPGTINVVSADRSRFYGRIFGDGRLELSGAPEGPLLVVLGMLSIDPTAVAVLYGKNTGHCCFCGRRLDRADSISLGYGPVCAEHWGFPHPFNGLPAAERDARIAAWGG